MSTPPIITIDQLTTLRAEGRVAEFWNVLTDDYFTGELIPGSRWVPLERVQRQTAA